MNPADYEALALKIVPKGEDRSRSELRHDIASVIAFQVEKAMAKQRQESFPELAALEASVKKRAADLEAAHKQALEAMRVERNAAAASQRVADADLRRREAAVKAGEDRLTKFLQAFDAYEQWLNGAGEVDENGKRFDALRAACASLKEKR